MISAVIVNWNSGVQLEACIRSIVLFGNGFVERIVVVDNGSTDASLKCLADFSFVEVIRNEQNIGFGAASNRGAGVCSSEFLLFLNPDAALSSDTLSCAIAAFGGVRGQDVGICGVQLHDSKGRISRSNHRFPSWASTILRSVGGERLPFGWSGAMTEDEHLVTQQVDHVIGAFYLVRRSVFEALLGFDERFFLYLEDLDFSLRARKAGWRTVYCAETWAFHEGGGSSKQIKARRLFYALRSRLVYAFKHFPFSGAFAVLLATVFVEPWTRTAYALVCLSWPNFKETWSAYGQLFRWLPRWLFRGETR